MIEQTGIERSLRGHKEGQEGRKSSQRGSRVGEQGGSSVFRGQIIPSVDGIRSNKRGRAK